MTLPQLRSALVAGGAARLRAVLRRGDRHDVHRRPQQTLPIWILTNLSRPNQLPIVNVVGVIVIVLSAFPVYLAHRLTLDPEGDSAAVAPAGAAAP